jgi:hypothetical protein
VADESRGLNIGNAGEKNLFGGLSWIHGMKRDAPQTQAKTTRPMTNVEVE